MFGGSESFWHVVVASLLTLHHQPSLLAPSLGRRSYTSSMLKACNVTTVSASGYKRVNGGDKHVGQYALTVFDHFTAVTDSRNLNSLYIILAWVSIRMPFKSIKMEQYQ